MALLAVHTSPGVPYYTQRTQLDGRAFTLHFAYNQREERWYLSIHDDENTPLLQGVKLIANWPLLQHYRFDPRLPPGELLVVDLTADGSPPKLDELGANRRCELMYLPATT